MAVGHPGPATKIRRGIRFMETPSKLIKYHQLARPEYRDSLTKQSPRLCRGSFNSSAASNVNRSRWATSRPADQAMTCEKPDHHPREKRVLISWDDEKVSAFLPQGEGSDFPFPPDEG